MAHIAFVVLPATGHVNPTLPLVAELVRRGHRVTYSGGGDLVDKVTAAGATALPSRGGSVRPTGSLKEMLLGGVEACRIVVPALEQVFAADRPDLLCYDALTPYGPLLAHRLGVPTVVLSPTHADSTSSLRRLLIPEDFDATEYVAARAKLAADLGVPLDPPTPKRQIVFLPRRFQLDGDTFDDSHVFVGPTLAEQSSDWQPPARASKVLFVSLGTVVNDRPDFFAAVTAAFADTDWHVAMAVGDQVDPAALGPIPPNIEVRPFFPQQTVLEHAAAFLTHAGMNSVMEALSRQVPMIAYPQTAEQTANAERVADLGLGRVLTDLADLAVTVTEVAGDADIRANLAVMADDLRAAGGAPAAADAVEAALP